MARLQFLEQLSATRRFSGSGLRIIMRVSADIAFRCHLDGLCFVPVGVAPLVFFHGQVKTAPRVLEGIRIGLVPVNLRSRQVLRILREQGIGCTRFAGGLVAELFGVRVDLVLKDAIKPRRRERIPGDVLHAPGL